MNVIHHHFKQVNGLRLHYLSAGRPEAKTIVLLAGFPQSSYAWRSVMQLLANTFHVIAPDLPGQGDSALPHSGYDTDTLAQYIATLLQQLGIHDYFLAGHDIGAWVAFPLAAQFPDAVKKLALLDAGIPGVTLPDALPATQASAWKTWHFAFHLLEDLPEALLTGREALYLDWFLRRKAANRQVFSEESIQEYWRIFTQPGGMRAGLAYYRAAAQSAQQNRSWLEKGKLAMPVLAVSADQGSIPDMALPLRQFARDVRGVTIASCGHFIPEEQPAALVETLTSFYS